jgi:hypothetical protein
VGDAREGRCQIRILAHGDPSGFDEHMA